MRISHMTTTQTLGPGNRYAIWVQGCLKRCKGCINPEGWKLDGGMDISVDDLIAQVLEKKDIVGVTISGGEPFLQYDELKQFVKGIKERSSLDIMLYSGYTFKELEEQYGHSLMTLMSSVDLFIDGEYIEELNNGSAYKGSDNQKIYYFTDKYLPIKEKINNLYSRDFSFEIKDGEDIIFVGIPPKGFYTKFVKKIGEITL